MMNDQAAILDDVPCVGRYVYFEISSPTPPELRASLVRLKALVDGKRVLVGLGNKLLQCLGTEVSGLHDFVPLSHAGVDVPATPVAMCCWLRGDDRGDLLHLTRQLQQALAPGFAIGQVVDAFRYGTGRDLTGYEDGTENPTGEAAAATALLQGAGVGLDGSSFMVVQQWQHNLDAFDAMSTVAQDHSIGRRRSDNEELDDAPPSAHVKRTAQESFAPAAFVLRRSMPWTLGSHSGLMFVAFGFSFDAFEVLMRHMLGLDDGVQDGLFGFSRPVTGANFWCPPMHDGRLDLRHLGM
jgi:putative iron-dependent peroxidase